MSDFPSLIDSLLIAGDVEGALDALKARLQAYPEDSFAKQTYERVTFSRQNNQMTGNSAQLQASGHGDNSGVQLEMLFAAEQFREMEPLITAIPSLWQREAWRGRLALKQGLFDQAAIHFTAALAEIGVQDRKSLLFPQRALLLLRRAEAYRRLKDWTAASHDYAAAEHMIPSDPMIPFMRALTIYRLHNASQNAFHKMLPVCRDALDSASAPLREQMRDALKDDPFYKPLAEALIGSQ